MSLYFCHILHLKAMEQGKPRHTYMTVIAKGKIHSTEGQALFNSYKTNRKAQEIQSHTNHSNALLFTMFSDREWWKAIKKLNWLTMWHQIASSQWLCNTKQAQVQFKSHLIYCTSNTEIHSHGQHNRRSHEKSPMFRTFSLSHQMLWKLFWKRYDWYSYILCMIQTIGITNV